MNAYETILYWLSLYPHTLGDELLKEISEEPPMTNKDKEETKR